MAIFHKFGGTITAVTHVGHTTERSVARWYFVGNVKWDDGSDSVGTQIAPNVLAHDDSEESRQEVSKLLDKLNEYLSLNGRWLKEPKRVRGGMVVNWEPKQKANQWLII